MAINSTPQSAAPPTAITTSKAGLISAMAEANAAAALNAKLEAMLGVGTFLTADELLAFAKHQIEKTDAQIRSHVADVTTKKDKAAVLQQISAGLRQVKGGSKEAQIEKFTELKALAEQAGLSAEAGKLENWISAPGGLLDTKSKWNSDHVEGFAQEMDARMTALTSNTELTMISIQGLMQQRNQVLQLASNVIAALNEPAKNAIGNLRGS